MDSDYRENLAPTGWCQRQSKKQKPFRLGGRVRGERCGSEEQGCAGWVGLLFLAFNVGQRNWSEDLKNFFLLRVERELEDKLGGKVRLMAFYGLGTHF